MTISEESKVENVATNASENVLSEQQVKESRAKNYLKVDPSVPGQEWCVMSFISPEDLIEKKTLFYTDHFLHEVMNEYLQASSVHMSRALNAQFNKAVEEKVEKLKKSKREDARLLGEELHEIRKKLEIDEETFAKECCHDHFMAFDDLIAKYQDYKVRKGTEMEKIFAEQNQFRCNTRGVKFCGAFPFPEAATERAKFLAENVEPGVHHYVAQSFHWLPFDPNPDAIQDNRYQNQELNELMRRKKENEDMRRKVFDDEKNRRVENARTQNKNLKKELRKKYKERKDSKL